jgi:class 3 adenylate cyclase/tetratricopeptide (TPR) repeat protein
MVDPRPEPASRRVADLLDRAVRAVNAGDLAGAHDLAAEVLAEDPSNADAEDLLAADGLPAGEVRRLTILGCDLVGSTELSERLDPERYRSVVGRYRRRALEIIQGRYDGHVVSTQGDGLMALFGYPNAHEDGALRAVRAALDVAASVAELSQSVSASAGGTISVRGGVHRGLVYIDVEDGDVYGLAANVAARLEALAAPGTVVISEEVRQLVGHRFDVEPLPPAKVKGVERALEPFRVLHERTGLGLRPSASPLVGRQRELAALQAAWDEAASAISARPVSVLVRGEPGLGKSRLAWELGERVRAAGAAVVELAGSSFHTSAAFQPVHDLLTSRCGIRHTATAAERLSLLRQELAARGDEEDLPRLAPVLGIPPEAGYALVPVEGRKLHEEIQSAAARYVLGCFGGRPGLLVVEDVHCFDEPTVDLLGQILRTGPGHLLVVLTARATPASPVPVTASRTLDLAPFTASECAELVVTLDDRGLSAPAVQALIDRADGVPLFLEVLVQASDAMSGREATGPAVPDVLYEPLVAQLSATSQGLASAVAIAGREVDRSVIAAAADVPPAELDTELDALVEANVLTVLDPGRGDSARYRFRHELLREVAAELLPPSRRQQVHARIADELVPRTDGRGPGDWLVLASHLEEAGRAAEAVTAYARAADHARLQGALLHARDHLNRALTNLDRLPAGRTRLEQEVALRLRRGFLAMSTEGAGSVEAVADYARCLELAMVDVRGDEMISTLISLWAHYLARADLARCHQVLDTLHASLSGDRAGLLAINLGGQAMLAWFEGDTATARTDLADAIAALPPADQGIEQVWLVPNDPEAAMHTHLALAHVLAGDTRSAEAALASGEQLTSALAFPQGPWSEAYRLWLGSWLLAELGRYDEALSSADELAALGERSGFDTWIMIAATQHAAVSALGRPTDGVVHAATLGAYLNLWEAAGLRVLVTYYLTVMARALLEAGERSDARARCHEAQALASSSGMRFYEPETARVLALATEGEAATRSLLHDALGLARRQGARLFELRIALDLGDRQGSAAHDLLAGAVAGFPPDARSADLDRARQRLGG